MVKDMRRFMIFLLIFSNCLTLTYVDHPEKAKEISEQNINKNKKDSVGSNQINITKSNYKANLNSPAWGVIGLFNLCVLTPNCHK